MKINEETLQKTPDEVLELLYQVLRVLAAHESQLTRIELELLSEAISKI